jgi:glycosyltransferase involved in cell wall biosynthesis
MRVTFLMPRYEWGPSGGYRIVCEHANGLVSRGHEVTIVHPRYLGAPGAPGKVSAYRHAREAADRLRDRLFKPTVNFQNIDRRVQLTYVPNLDPRNIPDGDAIFATAWGTVKPVLESPRRAGEKCYLIQGYETWQGPKDLVDATWRSSLHKVVVSKWLSEIGHEIGAQDLSYVPNGIDHKRYRLIRPIESRPRRIAMAFANAEVKGPQDGLFALEMAKKTFPDISVVMFGTGRRGAAPIPQWIEYHQKPPQDFIVNEIYNGSNIFLSSSRSEGFALPPAEAACCGCAVVASDSGGIRDFIRDGATGLLSPPRNPEALAKNLCLVLGDDFLRMKLAKAGHDDIARFNWERSTDLMEAFLLRVVQGNGLRQGVARTQHESLTQR